MTDALADRCSALGGIVVDLMRVTMEAQSDAGRLAAVATQARAMRGIVEQGSDGITDQAYLGWHADAPTTLDEMITAADRGDAPAAWRAFTHPTRGMAALGQACLGQPGW